MTPPVRALLADGRRQHFQHGPIDLVIEAFGEPDQVVAAFEAAWQRFLTILVELVNELPVLRAPAGQPVSGAVARRMKAACEPHRDVFLTPMAAVAGAVADEVLAAMTVAATLDRAYANNGGDIAIHLAPGETFRTGIVTLGATPALDGFADITAGVGSLSLGIADSVTVLAASSAQADVAATLIANAVQVDDPAVRRQPASDLDADSDLGDQLVTVDVGPLSAEAVALALERGLAVARRMKLAALLSLQGTSVTTVDGLEIAA